MDYQRQRGSYMSTKQPNSDDMEKLHPEQSTDPNTIEVDEDVQEQSNNKPFISDKSPAIFLASNESKEVTSNGPDKHDDDERNTYNSETIDTEKTLVRGELVPLVIDDVVQAPTQQLTSSSIDEAAKEYRSYTLYRDYTTPGRRRSRALRPLAHPMPRVRTSATLQRLRTQGHKK